MSITNNTKYQQCNKCVMDTTGNHEIIFDDKGICNYCYEYESKSKTRLISSENREAELSKIISKIKSSNKKK